MSAALDDVVHELALIRRQAIADIEWFYKDVLHWTPLRWQLKHANAVADIRRKLLGMPTQHNHTGLNLVSGVSGHGTGKTEWLAAMIHWWNFVSYGLIAATAPKRDQLLTRLLPRYRALNRKARAEYAATIEVLATRVKILGDEDNGLVCETATDPDNLAGYHADPQLIVIDEASARNIDKIYEVLEGTLTTPGSTLIEIGNPTRSEGEFWEHHNRRGVRELYWRFTLRPEDGEHLVSEAWVEKMRNKYGEDSPVFKVRVLGEFVTAEENQLIPMAWLEEAREEELVEDTGEPLLKVSVDVADGGMDYTTIIAGRQYVRQSHLLRMENYSFEASVAPIRSAEAAEAVFDEYGGRKGHDLMIVDAMGVGAGTAGILIKNGHRVVTYKGGESADNKNRFRNRRVQSYIALRDILREHRVVYADSFVDSMDDWLDYVSELCSIRMQPGLERVEDLETKEKHKARTGKSPDKGDATAMWFTTKTPTLVPYDGPEQGAIIVQESFMGANYDGSLTG